MLCQDLTSEEGFHKLSLNLISGSMAHVERFHTSMTVFAPRQAQLAPCSSFDERIARRFEASAGLCLPHVVLATECDLSHPDLVALVEAQRGKCAHLVAELEELCRKHALEGLVGRPGSSAVTSHGDIRNAGLNSF